MPQTLLHQFIGETSAKCPRCSYSLEGLQGIHCPECGLTLKLTIERPAGGEGVVLAGLVGLSMAAGFQLVTLVWLGVTAWRGQPVPTQIALALAAGLVVSVVVGSVWVWKRHWTSGVRGWRPWLAVGLSWALGMAVPGFLVATIWP